MCHNFCFNDVVSPVLFLYSNAVAAARVADISDYVEDCLESAALLYFVFFQSTICTVNTFQLY